MTAEVQQPTEEYPKSRENKAFELLDVLVEKVTGTVKWFSVHRHYGFIQRDDNNEDVFVHRSAIAASRSRNPTLKNGEPVEFSVVKTTGGVNAASVTGPDGQAVQGFHMYPRRRRTNYSSREGQFEGNQPNIVTSSGGDVEGTRQRGGPRRYRHGRGAFQPNRNGMGDGELNSSDSPRDEHNDGFGATETAAVPRGPPRRFRGANRRGQGRYRPDQQQRFHDEVNADANLEDETQRQQPRPSGPARRGRGRGRTRLSSGRAHREGGETAERSEAPEQPGVPLENQMNSLSLDACTPVSMDPKEAPTLDKGSEIKPVSPGSKGVPESTPEKN